MKKIKTADKIIIALFEKYFLAFFIICDLGIGLLCYKLKDIMAFDENDFKKEKRQLIDEKNKILSQQKEQMQKILKEES